MPERRVSQRDVDEIEIESDEEEENLEQGVGLSVQSTRNRRHSPPPMSRGGRRIAGKIPNGNQNERTPDRLHDDDEDAIFEDHGEENDDDEVDEGDIELLD
ncbi:GL12964 [Drosophila persimilis]|uniref:GL12964 n=1 Tax=Drosophila persimilis TaxID=7234 RepID=B4GVI3_DROPE|nr:GL12964 [Drosophila persimilis]